MSGRLSLCLCGFAGFAAMLFPASPAAAQCRLCEEQAVSATAAPAPVPPPVVEVDSNLNFGGLWLTGTAEGGATVHPDGSTVVTGGLSGGSAHSMAGTVRVQGEPGRHLKIDVPRRIDLHSFGGDVLAIEIMTDLPIAPQLDGLGQLTFRFGGSLTVSGDADGEYRGDLPLTVDYL